MLSDEDWMKIIKKKMFRWASTALFVCFVAFFIGYGVGYESGFDEGKITTSPIIPTPTTVIEEPRDVTVHQWDFYLLGANNSTDDG